MVGRETQVVGTWKICLSLCCFVMHERIKRRKWSFMMFVTLLFCHARENKEKKVVSIIVLYLFVLLSNSFLSIMLFIEM